MSDHPLNDLHRQLPAYKAQLIQVIAVESYRGGFTDADPVRAVYQYFSTDGRLLAEFDTIFCLPDIQTHEPEKFAQIEKTETAYAQANDLNTASA